VKFGVFAVTFRPELRKNKGIDGFAVSVKRRTRLSDLEVLRTIWEGLITPLAACGTVQSQSGRGPLEPSFQWRLP
ncbi:hypothetical protein, partial [Mesorhizobium sp. M2A.F.Ca.ET.017.03.2.1]|uniref:hypothetical protein n=1 Tax=Mesorhizobium sp. M2A.F.Ca.ET.017.03.2.1 TaxID=2496650 RepID=UPI001AECDAE3